MFATVLEHRTINNTPIQCRRPGRTYNNSRVPLATSFNLHALTSRALVAVRALLRGIIHVACLGGLQTASWRKTSLARRCPFPLGLLWARVRGASPAAGNHGDKVISDQPPEHCSKNKKDRVRSRRGGVVPKQLRADRGFGPLSGEGGVGSVLSAR